MPLSVSIILLLVWVVLALKKKKCHRHAFIKEMYTFAGSGFQRIIGCEDGSNDQFLSVLWLQNTDPPPHPHPHSTDLILVQLFLQSLHGFPHFPDPSLL